MAKTIDSLDGSLKTSLGYAASNHTHNYLPLSGGALTGALTLNPIAYDANYTKASVFTDDNVKRSIIKFNAASGSNDPGAIYLETSGTSADTNKGVLHLCPSDDSDNSGDYVSIHGTNDPEAIKLYAGGNASFIGTVTAPTFSGALSGNASTATTLQTARTLTIGSTGKAFNGSGNISWTLAEIGAAATSHNHDYMKNIGPTNPQTGRTQSLGDVYSYLTNAAANTGAPTTYTSVIGFGKGTAGTVEICGEWTQGKGLWFRALRDVTDDWYDWTRIYTTAYKPTPADIGAAAATHGTHVTYSSTAPKMAGTAAVGSEGSVARGDHVHAAQTSVSGNAGTATKLQTARTITVGGKSNSFDGSANIAWTIKEIGAMPLSIRTDAFDLNNLQTTGIYHTKGTLTNAPTTGNAFVYVNFDVGTPYQIFMHDATFKLYYRTYSSSAWTSWSHTLGNNISGNAGTATKLATARSITIGSKSNNFDGSGNISYSLADIGAFPKTGGLITGNSSIEHGTADLEAMFKAVRTDTKTSVWLGVGSGGTNHGVYSDVLDKWMIYADKNGVYVNGSAEKLKTARNIIIGNKTNSFNGTGNITYTLADIGAAAIADAAQSWSTVIKCATWSRLFWFDGTTTVGGSYFVNIRGTRSNVVHNATFIVNFSHASKCTITQLNNTEYSNFKVRAAVASGNGQGYFEMYDDANSATNATSQTIHVTLTRISGDVSITKYTTFIDGTTSPSGYSAVSTLTTVSGSYYSGKAAKAGTADKFANKRTITIGNKSIEFDGSGNISYSLSDIGAAASNHSHNTIPVKGSNTISSTTNDTVANWAAQGISFHWFTETGKLNDQPGQWGFVQNIGSGSDVHQVWYTQSSGTMFHRGGNGSGWNGSWRALIDNINFTAYIKPSTIGAAPNYQDRAMIDINTSGFSSSGSKATDANASSGSCYQFTTTSTATKLAAGNFDTVKFGKYALCLRMMTSNNTTTSNLVTVTVKNGSTSILSKSIKGTDFSSTSQYSNIYTSFDFNGSRGTLSLDITTTTTSGVTVKFDYAYISLMTPSVFI